MRRPLVFLALLALTGCKTAAPPAVVVACPPLPAWSAADQAAVNAELSQSDADPVVRAIEAYLRLRDADRACIASTAPKP